MSSNDIGKQRIEFPSSSPNESRTTLPPTPSTSTAVLVPQGEAPVDEHPQDSKTWKEKFAVVSEWIKHNPKQAAATSFGTATVAGIGAGVPIFGQLLLGAIGTAATSAGLYALVCKYKTPTPSHPTGAQAV